MVERYVALVVAFIALAGTIAAALFQAQANRYIADMNYRAAERSSDIKMIEIAVGILRSPVSDDLAQIRPWAMDIIDAGSARKFTKEERSALLKKALPFSDAIPLKFQAFDPCAFPFAMNANDKNAQKLLEDYCNQRNKSGANPPADNGQTKPIPMPMIPNR
jgi:hypothetical protein